MKLILSHGVSISGRLLAELIIVFALLLSLGRALAPFANEYRDLAAELISQRIHYPVSIGRIEAGWAGLSPLIKLRHVTIATRDGQDSLASFERIRVRINPWLSLVRGRLMPDSLILEGSLLEVVRRKDGHMLFRGFEPNGAYPSMPHFSSLEALAGLTLNLRDIRLNWADQVLGREFRFRAERLDLAIESNGIDLDSRIDLPDSLGESLRVSVQTRGPLDDFYSWRSRFYVHGRKIDPRGNPLTLPKSWPTLVGGRIDLEFWGDWRPGRGLDAIGEFSAQRLRLAAGQGAPTQQLALPRLAGRMALKGTLENGSLDLDHLSIITGRQRWPTRYGSIAWQRDAHGQRRWRGRFNAIDIDGLARLAELAPQLPPQQRQRLARLRPSGAVEDLDFSAVLVEGHPGAFSLRGVARDVGWHAVAKLPGVMPLSGRFHLTERGGQASVRGQSLRLDLPALLGHGLTLKRLAADVDWRVADGGWHATIDNLRLANADLFVTGTARLVGRSGEKPRLDLELISPGGPVARAAHYIPFPVLRHQKVRTFLRHAFVAGRIANARIGYHGILSKQAFRSGKAMMTAVFDVDDGQIHYHDGWPDARALNGRVRFDNARFSARIDRGMIFDSVIAPARVDIDNLYLSRLQLRGKARGGLGDVIRFLHDTPLAKHLTGLLAQTRASGRSELALNLHLPISRKLKGKEKPRLSGYIVLPGNRLALPKMKLAFEDIQGALAFTQNSYHAAGMTARFRGEPVDGDIETLPNGNTVVALTGDFDAATLLPAMRYSLSRALRGRSHWRATLTIPGKQQQAQGERLALLVRSNLRGIEVALPAPLSKAASVERPLTVTYRFGDNPGVELNYGASVQFVGEMTSGPQARLRRGVVRLLDSQRAMPAEGIVVAGRWPGIELMPWLHAIDTLRDPSQPGVGVKRLELDFSYLTLGAGMTLTDCHLDASHAHDAWQVAVRAHEATGALEIPVRWKQGARIQADFETLRLPAAGKGDEKGNGRAARFLPTDLPSLDLRVAKMQLGERMLGRLALRTTRTVAGLRIDSLGLDRDHYHALLEGAWNLRQGHQRLDLNVDVHSDDVGRALQDLQFRQGLRGGTGELNGHLIWRGPLLPVDFSRLSGTLDLQISQGKLSNVDPGLGRLISLVSLDNIPRRLALDFNDVADPGFYFDLLSGRIELNEGTLVTDNTTIASALADIAIHGSSSLITRQHHLALQVTPKIKSSIPVAAGMIAGPQTGAVVFLVDKFAESLGLDFNRSVTANYSITGDWSSPVIRSEDNYAQDEGADSEALPGTP